MSKTKIEWLNKDNTLVMNDLNMEDKVCKAEKGRNKDAVSKQVQQIYHFLENTKRETSQVTEFKQVGGTHKLRDTRRETGQSTEESKQARGTYILSSTEGGTRQDSKSKPAKKGHLLSVECRRRDWSGQ
jgi:hypothetical protein